MSVTRSPGPKSPPQRKMEALRDAYLLDVDKSSRPLQRFQEGTRLLKAAEEIVAVAQGCRRSFGTSGS